MTTCIIISWYIMIDSYLIIKRQNRNSIPPIIYIAMKIKNRSEYARRSSKSVSTIILNLTFIITIYYISYIFDD